MAVLRRTLGACIVAGAVAAAGPARAAAPSPRPGPRPGPAGGGSTAAPALESAGALPPLTGLAAPGVQAAARALDHGAPGRALALAARAGADPRLDPRAAPGLAFVRALALRRTGHPGAALAIFATLDGPAAPPGLAADVAFYHGDLLARTGRLQAAAAALGAVPLDSRFGLRAVSVRVRARLDRGAVDAACQLADQAVTTLEGTPGEARAWWLLAGCLDRQAVHLARTGHPRQARARLQAAAALDRGVATLWPRRASGRAARRRLAHLLSRGVHPAPPKVPALLARARHAVLHLHPRRALRAVRHLRRLLPARAHRARTELDLVTAELYVHIRWFHTARRYLRRVIREARSPEPVATAEVIHADLVARRRSAAAFGAYLATARRHPATDAAALALRRAARLAARAGDAPRAAALYRRCAQGHPTAPAADACRFGLAWLAWKAGRGDAARAWLATLLGPEPLPPAQIPPTVTRLPASARPLVRVPVGLARDPAPGPRAEAAPPAPAARPEAPALAAGRPPPPVPAAPATLADLVLSVGAVATAGGAGIGLPAVAAAAALAAPPAAGPETGGALARPLPVPVDPAAPALLGIRFHPDGRPEPAAVARRRLLERAAYWRGRIQAMQGDAAAARRSYLQVASTRPLDYYGLLAWDRLAALGVDAQAAVARRRPATPVAPPPHAAGLDPDVAAAAAYLRLGLDRDARRALLALDRTTLVDADRRVASRLWARLGDLRRSHRMAPVAWQGGLPAFPAGQTAADARLAYPRPWPRDVARATSADGVPPPLLYALMRAESGFEPRARSAAGALGLTQVMRRTAYHIARTIRLHHFRFWKLRRPAVSIAVGAAFLARLLQDFAGRVPLAVAAYNAGERAVRRWVAARGRLPLDAFVEEIPISETRHYVQKVLSFYAIYRALYHGALEHPLGLDPTRPVWQGGDSDTRITAARAAG